MANLIETIKKISQGANEATAPCDLLFGVVTNINPLEITVEQKLKLTQEFLILTKNVKDYTVEVSVNWQTEDANVSETHLHKINGNKTMTIHNALKKNDTVILIQKRGGQEYVVIDKI